MFRKSLTGSSVKQKKERKSLSKLRGDGDRVIIRLMEGKKSRNPIRNQNHRRLRSEALALPKVMHSSAGAIVEREGSSAQNQRNEFRLKESIRTSMDTRFMRYTEESNAKSRIKFSRNMMKGIRLKKFNELRIRMKDRKSTGLSKQRHQNMREDSPGEEIHPKEKEGRNSKRNKQLFILKQRISNTRRNLAAFKKRRDSNHRDRKRHSSSKVDDKISSSKKRSKKKSSMKESSRSRAVILTPNEKFLKNLSRFEVKDRLGKGAYARVHLVKCKELKKYFALKTYPKDYLTKPHRIANIRNEVGLLFEVSHPNIIKLHHVCETNDNIHLIMNRGGRKSLDKYLETRPGHRVSEKEAATMIKQLADSLLYLHKQGIAHRDIKLGNVLIGDNYKVCLIDFGFACRSGNKKLTTFCGTPCYMCPEILLKKPYYGQHADVWALGVLLYRLVCGTQPFKGKGKQLRKSITLGHFSIPQNLSTPLRGLLREMMHMNTSERVSMNSVIKYFNSSNQVLNSLWIMKTAP